MAGNSVSEVWGWAGVLAQHPGVRVEAAVHPGLPVTLVGQHVVLEAGLAGVSGGDPVGALVVDIALLSVWEVTLGSGTEVVRDFASVHEVLLDAEAEVPVCPGDIHQSGQSVAPAQVLHRGEVAQLSPGLKLHGLLVDRAEQGLRLNSVILGLQLLLGLELLGLELELLLGLKMLFGLELLGLKLLVL
jgi:hypothetical protein